MLYKYLRSGIIIATVLVWVRLFIGTVQYINTPKAENLDAQIVVTEQEAKTVQ